MNNIIWSSSETLNTKNLTINQNSTSKVLTSTEPFKVSSLKWWVFWKNLILLLSLKTWPSTVNLNGIQTTKASMSKLALSSPSPKNTIQSQFMFKREDLILSIQETFWELILHKIVQTKIFGLIRTSKILDSKISLTTKTLQELFKHYQLKLEETCHFSKQQLTMTTMNVQNTWAEDTSKYLRTHNIYAL